MLLLNNQAINYFTFPGGELQVKLPQEIKSKQALLTWKPSQSTHILLLMLTVNALHNMGVETIELDVLYLPYARQDRVCTPGEANSLAVICEILHNLKVKILRFWDVHNLKRTFELLEKPSAQHVSAADIFVRYKILDKFKQNDLVLCAPDKGATPRVNEIVNKLNLEPPIYLDKQRDLESGRIISLECKDPHLINGRNIMIVDDICDGGGTFIQAAEVLKKQGAKKLYLYITHGIFSKGLDELLRYYEEIICHHSLNDQLSAHPHLTLLKDFSNASEPTICN